jgi:hypothetical protein
MAEVMDKESSLLSVCLWALLPLPIAFLAARHRPWLLLLVLPMPLLFFVIQMMELLDASVGKAMLAEAGSFYVAASWSAPFSLVGATLLGLWQRARVSSGA